MLASPALTTSRMTGPQYVPQPPCAIDPLPVTVPLLLSTAVGTTLANTFHQIQEVPFDAQMARPRNRPLVRRAISPVHATGFTVATGIASPVDNGQPHKSYLGLNKHCALGSSQQVMEHMGKACRRRGSSAHGMDSMWRLLPSAEHLITAYLPAMLSSVTSVDLCAIDNLLAPFALFMLLSSWQFPQFNPLSHLI